MPLPSLDEKELALGRRLLHGLSHLHADGLKEGQRAPEVSDLQYYLRTLGYIQEDDVFTEGLFDDITAGALNRTLPSFERKPLM
jgi:hypothetical protein